MNIIQTICKLKMILPSSFFDLMEYLHIHLPFEVKDGGLVQYIWMYTSNKLEITHAS